MCEVESVFFSAEEWGVPIDNVHLEGIASKVSGSANAKIADECNYVSLTIPFNYARIFLAFFARIHFASFAVQAHCQSYKPGSKLNKRLAGFIR